MPPKTEEAKEVKIEKMVLNIDGEMVSLSMDQAKKLKGILDELFGKEIVKEIVREEHHHHHKDWWYYPYFQTNNAPLLPNTVYCSNDPITTKCASGASLVVVV